MKMKAAQTMSPSVAFAIDFLCEDPMHPEFVNSQATSEFICLFSAVFDAFDSKNVLGHKLKAPIKAANEYQWISLLTEAKPYIEQLTKANGIPLLLSRLKAGFLGFCCTTDNLHNIYEDLVLAGHMKYILTYKLSQDHLEPFFGALRSHFGSNNNPTVTQVEAAFKYQLVQHDMEGHCLSSDPQDNTNLLTSLSCCQQMSQAHCVADDDDIMEGANLDLYCNGTGKFKEAVVGYIAGYVVKMVKCKSLGKSEVLSCIVCLLKTTVNSSHCSIGKSGAN